MKSRGCEMAWKSQSFRSGDRRGGMRRGTDFAIVGGMTNMKITALEAKMIRNVAENNFQDGMEGTNQIWANCLDQGPCLDIRPAQFGGLCASLVSKGLLVCQGSGRNAIVWLTPAGLAAWRASATPDVDVDFDPIALGM